MVPFEVYFLAKYFASGGADVGPPSRRGGGGRLAHSARQGLAFPHQWLNDTQPFATFDDVNVHIGQGQLATIYYSTFDTATTVLSVVFYSRYNDTINRALLS